MEGKTNKKGLKIQIYALFIFAFKLKYKVRDLKWKQISQHYEVEERLVVEAS